MSTKVLFLTPKNSKKNLGGVEKHVRLLSDELKKRGHKIRELSLSHDRDVGKLAAWKYLWRNRSLISWADLVHIHDVFWWYLPLRFVYLNQPVFTTFHGWEGVCPPTKSAVLQKRLAQRLSQRTIGVGKYFEKWYGVKPDRATFGALLGLLTSSDARSESAQDDALRQIAFFGRLELVNGIEIVIEAAKKIKKIEFLFIGDGSWRKEAEKVGEVTGMIKKPEKYLTQADLVIASSYLSMLEAAALGRPIISIATNPLKLDYLKSHPIFQHLKLCQSAKDIIRTVRCVQKEPFFRKQSLKQAQAWARQQTPAKLTDIYEELWRASLMN